MVMGYDLLSIMAEQQQDEQMPVTGREGPPVACPNDGTPLQPGNPMAPEVELYCPWGDFHYPRDWVRPDSNYH